MCSTGGVKGLYRNIGVCSFQVPVPIELQEFILCVLLVSWTTYVDMEPRKPWEMIEFFAGIGNIACAAHDAGYKTAALDLSYDGVRSFTRRFRLDRRSPFDLNSESGFS